MPTKQLPKFSHLGSLIICDEGTDQECLLGYLMPFKGKGVYDANHGKVDVSPEHAEIHNKLLSEAQIKGLDEQCQVGQGGHFYFSKPDVKSDDPQKRTHRISTFTGEVVASAIHPDVKEFSIGGQNISFVRKGRRFRGRRHKEDDSIFIKRVE